jgi:hypothetical protein
LCWQCTSRLARDGWTLEEIEGARELPPLPRRAEGCLVPGCQRMSPGGRQGQRSGLCQAHSRRIRRVPGTRIEDFLADGTCTEPSNVAAAGGACPVRFRCAGCDHFRTDVSYLPDLAAHLDDLLRTRERLAAAISGVDEWARADATPAEEEITRIRRLISRIKGDIAGLPADGRARIDEAVTVIRKHRAVSLGMPGTRPPAAGYQART